MLFKRLALLLGSLTFSGVLIFMIVRGTLGLPATTTVGTEPPRQEVIGDIESPTLSSISSPSPTCSRPAPGTGTCYIQWNYLYVTAASSSYVISMTVSINNQTRAYHAGFFQSSMYIPADMLGHGYKVTCGFPQGNIGLGNIYPYAIRARESSGTTAANFGSVTCPADVVMIYLPAIQKH